MPISSLLCLTLLLEAAAYVARSNEDLDIGRNVESMETEDLMQSDLAQAQFDAQELIVKHTSWMSLCNLRPKGSQNWRRCRAVLDSNRIEIRRKEDEVATLQKSLDALQAGKQAGLSFASLQVKHEAADTLGDHLSRANFELEQLSEKRDIWKALCDRPLQQRVISKKHGLSIRRLSQHALPDKNCLEIVHAIERDIAGKRKAIASYETKLTIFQK